MKSDVMQFETTPVVKRKKIVTNHTLEVARNKRQVQYKQLSKMSDWLVFWYEVKRHHVALLVLATVASFTWGFVQMLNG